MRPRHRPPISLALLLCLAATPWLAPRPARGQDLVVATFVDKTKRGVGEAGRKALVEALSERGVRLISYDDYLKRAAKLRFKGGKALTPKGIAATAKAIPVDGVVTGSALPGKAGVMLLTIVLYDAHGKQLRKITFKLRKPNLPAENAAEAANLMLKKLGKSVKLGSPAPAPEPAPEPAPPPKAKPGDDAFLPAWARAKPGAEPDKAAPDARPAPKAEPVAKAKPEAEAEAPPREEGPRQTLSSNEILAAAGASLHARHGLVPRHAAEYYPGFRVDLRLFLGAFVDDRWLGGLGLGGMFDMGLGLEYARSDTGETFSAMQYQWRAELLYRITLAETLSPALILRVGYGGASNAIEDAGDDLATSASYLAPYVALDFTMFLWRPYLRFYLSGMFLFAVQPGEEIKGDGLGFGAFAGFDVNVTDYLTIGLGYDLTQYLMDDGSTGGVGAYSDTFQAGFLRVGYTFR